MANDPVKVILDTNLWISFLITNDFSQLDNILFTRKAKLIFNGELMEEFVNVVSRPKFQKYFTFREIEEVLEIIEEFSEYIKIKSEIDLCRDKKDNFLLSLAKDSNADFLITGDKDLLEIKNIASPEY